MKKIQKIYEAQKFENTIYKKWEKSGLFTPKINHRKKPFIIPMPPPNATGTLHLGHATMLALQDIMIRYKRMQGFPTLWLPGTDHAAIATNAKIEKILAEEGETRFSLGRERFLKRVHSFIEESRFTIRNQIRKMGSSCDWSREQYTLDESLSQAVREIFVRMSKDGLIYRGDRIVNWCTNCHSTLADDEVQFKEEKTKFYYLRFGPVVIGTARPETKFLDKTIVAHPDDTRYKKYFGKNYKVPWIEGDIEARFLADKSVDPKFGSGAMTLTPAHDFLDFDLAKKHQLEVIQIIDINGNFTQAAGKKFAGKNARESREEIVRILEKKGLLKKTDNQYIHNISICYRCGSIVEPLISKQWFVDVNKPVIKEGKTRISLKQKGIDVVKKGDIEIIPDRFKKIYYHWLQNLRDWCISRQIWFGHQIPVWYCTEKKSKKCSEPIIQTQTPKCCPHCTSKKIQQDPDTLDTWFSSGLWTFSTLGWPKKTKDLAYFHPASVLETGYDILFFWVARMILMTTYALKEIPFKKVYLHGLVRDRHGKKMSKSAGNGIDPLEMIKKFGTDAVRLSLVIGTSPGNDIRLYEEKIASYRNFVNKIWNSARFAFLRIEETDIQKKFTRKSLKSYADKWIVTKLQKLIKEVSSDLEKFQFSEAGIKIYNFTWDEYCDWYLEISKGEYFNPDVLLYVLKNLLKLLHPFVPFVTETLWSHLETKNLLMAEKWPQYNPALLFKKETETMEIIHEVIGAIRSIRAEKGIEGGRKITATLYSKKWHKFLEEKREPIMRLGRLESLTILPKGPKLKKSLWKYMKGVDIYLPIMDLFDQEKEQARLKKKLCQTEEKMQNLKKRLDNAVFLKKAPRDIIEKEKKIFSELEQELKNIHQKMNEFS